MTTRGQKRVRKKLANVRRMLERMQKAPREDRSVVRAAIRKAETVTAKEDAPFAAKRKHMSQSAVDWMKARGHLSEQEHDAALRLAEDHWEVAEAPRLKASDPAPRIRGRDDSLRESERRVETYERYRWIRAQLQLSGSWPILQAVVIEEQSLASWTQGRRDRIATLRQRRARLQVILDGMLARNDFAAYRRINRLDGKVEAALALALMRFVGEDRATKELRLALLQAALRRDEYFRIYGRRGPTPGTPRTAEAAAERKLVFGY